MAALIGVVATTPNAPVRGSGVLFHRLSCRLMRIAQLSDIHVLDPRFEERLLDAAIEEINAEDPDLVVVAGDLTAAGYREEFEYARERLDRVKARQVVYVP